MPTALSRFPTAVDAGSPYNVTVRTQPANPSQTCTVANAAGTSQRQRHEHDVTCSTGSFSVGGTVIRSARQRARPAQQRRRRSADRVERQLHVRHRARERQRVRSDRGNSTDASVADLHGRRRLGHDRRRRRAHGQSHLLDQQVHDPRHGHRPAGSGLVLQNNGGDDVGVQSDGGFAFPTQIASGSGYRVEVRTQPTSPAQACSVQNGSGTVADRDVDNIVITCALRQFTIGGTINEPAGARGSILANNGTASFNPTADGPFTFPTARAQPVRLPSHGRVAAESAVAVLRHDERQRRRARVQRHERPDRMPHPSPSVLAARSPG